MATREVAAAAKVGEGGKAVVGGGDEGGVVAEVVAGAVDAGARAVAAPSQQSPRTTSTVHQTLTEAAKSCCS